MVDVTKQTYGNKIEKSPDFATEVKVVFSDDVSVETMRLFQSKDTENWLETMLKEVVLDWNLTDEKDEKMPICVETLDKIKSIKLRNWIIETLRDILVGSLTEVKKK